MMIRKAFALAVAAGFCCFAAAAEDGPRGHWAGSMEAGNRTVNIEFDLDKTPKGWIGSMSIPEQKVSGIPLESVTFDAGKITFSLMKSGDKTPGFTGKLADDGKSITGELKQGEMSTPLQLKRTGDPKVDVPKASPLVSKALTGKWEGTLEAGQPLRLVLNVVNKDDGAVATLISIDQGGAEIPVTTVTEKEGKVSLKVSMVNGGFDGQMNKEGTELSGDWNQNGNTLPLKLTKK